ncbi:sporozoite micronemal protein essential for cell traversal, putative [Plasmodium gallinaceum]|uniref:Sporozoite micronemal protein essential for cell traversal, putative n=1 Tax=Plasmodium gallinaceum TaxID=5849 RepID=A0A1J1GZW1_PLAGA|nr:sporozoite micronemal protein essential for cell traversal, putative [Plasmodium gallinaceum]CRG98158.1 sporozoite micronemal protein essential for cell traversal, putative [Plasmodium gallinaceum]
MKNIKKYYFIIYILTHIFHVSLLNSINVGRNKNYIKKEKDNIILKKNENLISLEENENILCINKLCKNKENTSFVNIEVINNNSKKVAQHSKDVFNSLEKMLSKSALKDNDDKFDKKNDEENYNKEDDEDEEKDRKKDDDDIFDFNDNNDEENNNDESYSNNDDGNIDGDTKLDEDKKKRKLKMETEEKIKKKKENHKKKKYKKYNFTNEEKMERKNKIKDTNNIFHNKIHENNEDSQINNENENNKNIMYNDPTVFPGLYFVGIGYDLLFGNPLGEIDSLTDPGYRAQIYIMEWELSDEGIANDLVTLQPLNGWIRKESACSRVESINECSSISDYTKTLSVEAKVEGGYIGLASFSASAGYKRFVNEISKRSKKTYFIKSNCIKYTVGLPPYVEWKTTTAFSNALNGLPSHFTGLDKDSECSSGVYEEKKSDKACENVNFWMEFFKVYGTHIITEAQLGGKITKIIDVSNSSISKMKKEGVSVKTEIRAQFGFSNSGGSVSADLNNSSKNNNENYNMKETLIVMGGNPIKDVTKEENLYEWSKTVSTNPMPINIKLTPMSNIFETDELKNSYEKAIIYYSRVFGHSAHDTMQKEDKDIITILTNSTTITKTSPPPISAECPHNEVVLFGFSLKQNFWNNTKNLKGYDIEICEPGSSSCTSKQGHSRKYDSAYLYMECGAQPLPFSEQVVSESISTFNSAKCPNDYSIIFGFGLSSSSSRSNAAEYIYATPCRPGLKECSLNMSSSNEKSYIYLVCVDTTIWSGVNDLSLVALDNFHGSVDRSQPFNDGKLIGECPSNGTILSGFKAEFHSSNPFVKAPFDKCAKSLRACSVHGCGKGIGLQNYRSLFMVLLCRNTE